VFKSVYQAFHISNLLNPMGHHVLCFTFMLFQGWGYESCYRRMFKPYGLNYSTGNAQISTKGDTLLDEFLLWLKTPWLVRLSHIPWVTRWNLQNYTVG